MIFKINIKIIIGKYIQRQKFWIIFHQIIKEKFKSKHLIEGYNFGLNNYSKIFYQWNFIINNLKDFKKEIDVNKNEKYNNKINIFVEYIY